MAKDHEQLAEAAEPNPQAKYLGKKTTMKELVYRASSLIVSLFIPVSICMFLVILGKLAISSLGTRTAGPLIPGILREDGESAGDVLSNVLINALVFIAVLALMTFLLLCVVKYGASIILKVYFPASMMFAFSGLSLTITGLTSRVFNLYVDWILVWFLLWNINVIYFFSLFLQAPLRLQQACYIVLGASVALVLNMFLAGLEWTQWAVLFFLCLWDLFAVLTPCGPLKKLVEIMHSRGDENLVKGILYSTTANVALMGKNSRSDSPSVRSSRASKTPRSRKNSRKQSSPIRGSKKLEEKPIKLESDLPKEEPSAAFVPFEANLDSDPTDGVTEVANKATAGASKCSLRSPRAKPDGVTVVANKETSGASTSSLESSSCSYTHPADRVSEAPNKATAGASKFIPGSPEPTFESSAEPGVYHDSEDDEDTHGPKLGMGDFVFYSLLVAVATDPASALYPTIACFLAILVGLGATLTLLVLAQKALPALPISIFLAISVYFWMQHIATPFLNRLSYQQFYH